MTNSLKFGTSGLRGLASELAGAEARRYAAAFARHALGSRRGPLLVGRDLRASSPPIAADVIAAVRSLDIDVLDCGELPTPALALEAIRIAAPAIMVTGSHIPADRNGLKFYLPSGEIDKDDEARIVALLGDAPNGSERGKAHPDALDRYRRRCAALLPRAALAGRRIGVWQHSSVARDLVADVLAGCGAEVLPLGRSEAFVPVDTEAVDAEAAARLAGWVRAHRLDALVSTDGDGDRPLLVDERGTVVRGDMLGTLTARFLGAGVVVTPVTSNSSIEATGAFDTVVRTKVGSPYVIAGMNEAKQSRTADRAIVGFEANGGVLLGTDVELNGARVPALATRDAMLPLLCVLGAAVQADMPLSRFVATLPSRIARSDRLQHVPAERSAKLIARLRADAAGFFGEQGQVAGLTDIDGLRFTLASGDVVHYRPSGNAPELRCYTEAATAERAEALLAWGLEAAEKLVR